MLGYKQSKQIIILVLLTNWPPFFMRLPCYWSWISSSIVCSFWRCPLWRISHWILSLNNDLPELYWLTWTLCDHLVCKEKESDCHCDGQFYSYSDLNQETIKLSTCWLNKHVLQSKGCHYLPFGFIVSIGKRATARSFGLGSYRVKVDFVFLLKFF